MGKVSNAGFAPPAWLKAAPIVLAGAWAFWPALHGAWLWDDDLYITGNPLLRSPAGLVRIWVSPPGVNYFPVTATVQWLQWHLWGLDSTGYHLTNIALHLASALLLWRLLEKLGAPWAWLGGLLFAVHPLAVESVAWVSEIKNTLSLPPLLLSIGAYVDYDAGGKPRDYRRALAWFVVAMLCKSTVVMLPAILLLYVFWKKGRLAAADFVASLPFFGISLALGLVTIWFERHRAEHGAAVMPEALLARAAAAGHAAWFYLGRCLVPVRLLPIYPRWNFDGHSMLQFWPWLLFAAAFAGFWIKRRSWGRHLLLGLGWFLLNLLPVLGFIPAAYLRISWVADHFAYLSLVGVVGLAAAGAGALEARLAAAGRRPASGFLRFAAAAAVVALCLASRGYARVFRGPEELWSYTLRRNPGAWVAENDLGQLLLRQGKAAEAMARIERALALHPEYADAENNLAAALADLNRPEDAVAHYRRALQLNPTSAETNYNLGIVLDELERPAQAIDRYREALRLKPDYAEARANLGADLARSGRVAEAIPELKEALRLSPGDLEARADLGIALAQAGKSAEAIAALQQVWRARPDMPGVDSQLADLLLTAGRYPEAIRCYQAALRLRPDDRALHTNLALALRAAGRADEAEAEFARAAELPGPAQTGR